MPYPIAYATQTADAAWVQTKSAHSQNYYPAGAQRETVYYDAGEASPASDDSNAAFYDSPASSEASTLAEDYGTYGRGVG